MELTDEVLSRSEKIQEEIHGLIEQVKKTDRGKKLEYQDLLAVCLMLKIAELQEQIDALKLSSHYH
jgi:hypothetical protein